jgi:hypothetical protein
MLAFPIAEDELFAAERGFATPSLSGLAQLPG